jgi:AcrR family transcriptional regulator
MEVVEGLRERKKRQTREAIAGAALELFQARGFDDVTVADVARAADVSEKTVFNYFPTKEDLVFHRGEARMAALVEAIRSRPAGASVVEVFRRWTMDVIDRLESEQAESLLVVPRLVRQSAALRDRLFIGWEEEAATLSPVIAEEAAQSERDLEPWVVARTLAWTYRIVYRFAVGRLLAGEDQRAVAAELREQAGRVFDLLESGLGEYGVKAG